MGRRWELARSGSAGDELVRPAVGRLHVRAAPDGASERIIEGIVVPFGQVTMAPPDQPGGQPYRETIVRGATDDLDPSSVLLESIPWDARGRGHAGAVLVGRGFAGEVRPEGHHVSFRIARTRAGDEALELAREGIAADMSVVFEPVPGGSRSRSDGVIERSRINVRRVAVLEGGAYEGARVTAVRAAQGGDMNCPHCGAQLVPGVGHTCEGTRRARAAAAAAAPPPAAAPGAGQAGQGDDEEEEDDATPAPNGPRANRTRVTVDVERAAAERAAAAEIGRGSAGGPRHTMRITRAEPVYGPGSGRSFFGDGFAVSERASGWEEAAGRLERHYRQLEDIDLAIQRSAWFAGGELGRAGEVLSSEIPGAYPNEYLPGLLVARVLKQRPLGGFYQHVPLTDGRPRIYPVVSTSTTVAAQGAEGANPAASDFATTATTVTPVFYGGETSVSRQVLDGADPSIDLMLNQDLTEAYAQASEAVIRAAVEAGSTASGVTLTAATPNIGLINLALNHLQTVFLPAERIFLPTTLTSSWLTQLDTTNRPLAPWLNPMNSSGNLDIDLPIVGQIVQTPVAQSWASTAGAGAGVGGVAVAGRRTDFAIFESSIVNFRYEQGAGAPASIRIGLWAYLVVGTRRGSRKATGA